jgi:hypothetical protein
MPQPTHRHDMAHRGLVPTDQLGTGTPDGTQFLRDDHTWQVPAGGGGASLTVKDEGSPLATAATSLDFVGAGVTASGTGAGKTVTIPGATADLGTIVVCFDGGGAELTPKTQDVFLPASGTLTGWTLLADTVATASITVKAAAYGSYPPTASITGGSDPALAGTTTAADGTLAAWTKPFSAGTCLRFALSAATVATRLFLILTYTR